METLKDVLLLSISSAVALEVALVHKGHQYDLNRIKMCVKEIVELYREEIKKK